MLKLTNDLSSGVIWEQSVRAPLLKRMSSARSLHVVFVILIAGCATAHYLLTTRVFDRYFFVHGEMQRFTHTIAIASLVSLSIVTAFVSSAWRTRILLLASVAWLFAFVPVLLAAALLASASALYCVVTHQRLRAIARAPLTAALFVSFAYATWRASQIESIEHAIVKSVFQFALGVALLRMSYFVAEGVRLRQGVEGDSLAKFLVFTFFFPFAAFFIVLMSYVEFLDRDQNSDVLRARIRGVEMLVFVIFKMSAVYGLELILSDLRQKQFHGGGSTIRETGHLWFEVCYPYVHIYLAMSIRADLCTGWARLMGYDIEPAFRLPLLARNMKELWVRWNVYFRQWLVNLCYYPVVRRLSDARNPLRHGAALVVACVLTFLLSALVHVLFYKWPSPWPRAVAYFQLQAIPVCYVLIREYQQLQRARRLKQRPPKPDAFFTPFFIALTFTYQSVIHYCFSEVSSETLGQSLQLLYVIPIRLLALLTSDAWYLIAAGCIAAAILRWLHRRRTDRRSMSLPGTLGIIAVVLVPLIVLKPLLGSGIAHVQSLVASEAIGPDWSRNRGAGLMHQGKLEEAALSYRQALIYEVSRSEAVSQLRALANMGLQRAERQLLASDRERAIQSRMWSASLFAGLQAYDEANIAANSALRLAQSLDNKELIRRIEHTLERIRNEQSRQQDLPEPG